MKLFIKYLILTLSGAIIIYIALLSLSISYRQNTNLIIKPQATTAVFGSSTGQCAINDSILDNYQNIGASGTYYTVLENLIHKIITNNPQIKTVIFCYDPYLYSIYPDEETINFPPSRYSPFSGYLILSNANTLNKFTLKQLIRLYIGSNLLLYPTTRTSYGYRRLPYKINSEIPYDKPLERGLTTAKKKDIPYAVSQITHSQDQTALRNAISFCLSRKLDIIILSTPMYHLDQWYGSTGYDDFLSTLDKSVKIADYWCFPMPSDEYYGDAIHLNGKGSDYFSTHIKEHGLKLESLEEYLARKRREREEIE